MKNQENKNIVLELEFENSSEHVSNLNKALVHVLDMAAGFDEDRLSSNDMFWFGQLLQATMKCAWTVSDRNDPMVIKSQLNRRV